MSYPGGKGGAGGVRERECCVCHARASFNAKRPPAGEPEILSISFSVYLRRNGVRILKACPRVMICLKCLREIASVQKHADALEESNPSREWAWRGGRFQRTLIDSLLSNRALEQCLSVGEGAKIA